MPENDDVVNGLPMSGLPAPLDVFEFVRRQQSIRGRFSVHHLSRLLDGLPEQPLAGQAGSEQGAGVVRFEARGLGEVDGKALLELSVHAVLMLECQRCLGPLSHVVDSKAVFDVVRSESALNADDEMDEDDEPERILGSRRFDLLELIEDELILGVPYIPRHDLCPGQSVEPVAAAPDAAERPSPFAVLGKLKDQDK
jgi:uncharacterized protein